MSALVVQDLSVAIERRVLVDGVSFSVSPGECVAIVGESGAGKSLTASALLGLAPGRVTASVLDVDGVDVRRLSESQWREVRGARIALVAQDALVSLDPLRRIGAEIAEPLAIHTRLSRAERRERVIDLLESVAMPAQEQRARQYPHELSGGLRQRALIASALAGDPAVLVADEPTTALDATVQARVLALLREIADAGTAVVFISHDFAAVRRVADRVLVMRGGRVIEQGAVAEVLDAPTEEYTRALIAATDHEPRSDRFGPFDRLRAEMPCSRPSACPGRSRVCRPSRMRPSRCSRVRRSGSWGVGVGEDDARAHDRRCGETGRGRPALERGAPRPARAPEPAGGVRSPVDDRAITA
ncbi:ABC transporter ATP-binding protein [Microbacterium tenebrionis]|uniref:ABC transporter ATP-binding protein n=1 Tax=Microbacterium tenebrionis TaxID=2830665 RepID=UPI00202AD343|nr:ABC transporter ATP-binding protein [Microbacterium ihumii]